MAPQPAGLDTRRESNLLDAVHPARQRVPPCVFREAIMGKYHLNIGKETCSAPHKGAYYSFKLELRALPDYGVNLISEEDCLFQAGAYLKKELSPLRPSLSASRACSLTSAAHRIPAESAHCIPIADHLPNPLLSQQKLLSSPAVDKGSLAAAAS